MLCLGGECPCIRAVCHYIIEVSTSCRLVSSSRSVTLEDVQVLGECCQSGRDYSLNFLVLVYVSRAISLSQVDVAFSVLVCCFPLLHLSSNISSSDLDSHIHLLIPVVFVAVHVLY